MAACHIRQQRGSDLNMSTLPNFTHTATSSITIIFHIVIFLTAFLLNPNLYLKRKKNLGQMAPNPSLNSKNTGTDGGSSQKSSTVDTNGVEYVDSSSAEGN
jgi:hypothetical protein